MKQRWVYELNMFPASNCPFSVPVPSLYSGYMMKSTHTHSSHDRGNFTIIAKGIHQIWRETERGELKSQVSENKHRSALHLERVGGQGPSSPYTVAPLRHHNPLRQQARRSGCKDPTTNPPHHTHSYHVIFCCGRPRHAINGVITSQVENNGECRCQFGSG